MKGSLHAVCVHYGYDLSLTQPESLLERYETQAAWAESLQAAGAIVSVVQRFSADIEITRNAVRYQFVRDLAPKHGSVVDSPRRVHHAIAGLRPDVVHVHGLQFGRQAWQLKRLLGPVPILVQDHGNLPPRHWLNRFTLRIALRRMDAVSFVSKEQARPWLEGGFLRSNQTVAELMEGSSRFSVRPRAEARARTGLSGSPICLWVGRLNANKDPLTVLRGFGKALLEMPSAMLAVVHGASDLLDSVHRWLDENPTVAARVRLLGSLPHSSLEDLYNSADLFVLGSHHEGSGFAVLEALACGAVPVITDIPSFRILTDYGTVGGLWQAGSPDALAQELKDRYSGLLAGTPQQVRAFFDARFSWKAIGSSAIAVYRQLVERAQ